MSDFICISKKLMNGTETLACDGRALHAFLESRQHFTDWIKKRIEKYGFTEGVDFIIHKKMINENNCLESTYFLTIDMAKQLAMVENNEKGLQVRRYFIECERIAKDSASIATQPAAAVISQLLPIFDRLVTAVETLVERKSRRTKIHRPHLSKILDESLILADAQTLADEVNRRSHEKQPPLSVTTGGEIAFGWGRKRSVKAANKARALDLLMIVKNKKGKGYYLATCVNQHETPFNNHEHLELTGG